MVESTENLKRDSQSFAGLFGGVFTNSRQTSETSAVARLPVKSGLRVRISMSAIFLDVVCIAIAYLIASYVYLGTYLLEQAGRTVISLVPIVLILNLNSQAYTASVLMHRWSSAARGIAGLASGTLLLFVIFFFLKIGQDYSRVVMAAGTIVAAFMMFAARSAIAEMASRLLGESPFSSLCIYDGIKPGKTAGAHSVVASEVGLTPDPSDPAVLDRLGKLASGIDGLVVHCTPERREQWAFLLKSVDVRSEIVAPEITGLRPLEIRKRAGDVSLVLSSGQLVWSQRLLKRSFDLFIALCALPILLPATALIALAVKLDSKGPAFFNQERIGLGNRKFRIMKFRTMHVEKQDDSGARSASRDDDRTTRLGKILRKTSLDELPQFFNVLKGDMSVVGPRPHAELSKAGSSLFWEVDNAYWHRHVVKPGITGLAQVRGHRGATETHDDLTRRLDADLEYVNNWSLWQDIRIVLLTAKVVVHRNAF